MVNVRRVEAGATAAFVVAIAGAVALVTIVLFFVLGQPFGTLNDVALLVMFGALQPVMLAHYELGGVVPLWPARLSLAAATLAVAAWAVIQLAFVAGLVSFDYDHAATGWLLVQSLLLGGIGLWIAGASLLAGRWLPPAVRVLGMISGAGTLLVAAALIRSGFNDPLAYVGGLGFDIGLPLWALLLGRALRARAASGGTVVLEGAAPA